MFRRSKERLRIDGRYACWVCGAINRDGQCYFFRRSIGNVVVHDVSVVKWINEIKNWRIAREVQNIYGPIASSVISREWFQQRRGCILSEGFVVGPNGANPSL